MEKAFPVKIIGEETPVNTYGGKAYWLSWLKKNGYNVPHAVFLPAVSTNTTSDFIESDDFENLLSVFHNHNNKYSLAIRSSGILEDSRKISHAGHFKSFVSEMTLQKVIFNIKKVVASFGNSSELFSSGMGVVLQNKINGEFSGVAFSSNINGAKNQCVISVVEGMGNELVSGKVAGEDIVVLANVMTTVNQDFQIPNYQIGIAKQYVEKICTIAKNIEAQLSFPVDIEWTVEKGTGTLFLLQCRPQTGIVPENLGLLSVKKANQELIPAHVAKNDKVKIRLTAEERGIFISNAYLVSQSDAEQGAQIDWELIRPSEFCKGYSVVLIYPTTISGKVMRQFSRFEKRKQGESFRNCQRYKIRTYLGCSDLEEIVQSVQGACSDDYWFCVSIIQEIFEPEFTGIIKKITDGYLIEIAKGHFVPKGLVVTSQYVVNFNNEIAYKDEVIQPVAYNILEGKVSKQEINLKISVNEKILFNIIDSFSPLFEDEFKDTAIEFGILKDTSGQFIPYLIDLVDDKSNVHVDANIISEGIISPGLMEGRAIIIDTVEDEQSLNLHYHSTRGNTQQLEQSCVFICNSPDISLLKLLESYDNSKIGFIFNEGSALAHFSIVLREKRIPAIVLKRKIANIKSNDIIKLDASTSGLQPEDRFTVQANNFVLAYINPDTDGVCSSVAYSYLMNKSSSYYTPVVFGQIGDETKFVFDSLSLYYPIMISRLRKISKLTIVDTHNTAQLPKSLPLEKVEEIIDHHPEGNLKAFPNAKIQNEEVGAVCTLIAERMKNKGIIPNEKIAKMMAFAIASNTLDFHAPSTKERDKQMYRWLLQCAKTKEIPIQEMFRARSSAFSKDTVKILAENLKEYVFEGRKIGIIQVELPNLESLIERPDFFASLPQLETTLRLEYILFNGIDLTSYHSYVVIEDIDLQEFFYETLNLRFLNNLATAGKILQRKTDFVPSLEEYFSKALIPDY